MKQQLSRRDWLEFGLKTLLVSGAGGLKADPMSKALGVSRGSFYWHFRDIEEFRSSVLDLWKEMATVSVMKSIDKEADRPDRLPNLIALAFTSEPDMERAVRAWALHDAEAARSVAKVDDERVEYIVKLLHEDGLKKNEARIRANLIYCAYVGQMVLAGKDKSSTFTIDIVQMSELLLGK